MKMQPSLVTAVVVFSAMNLVAQTPSLAPQLLILNADVRTMDAQQPQAEALAISGNKIVAVGKSADLKALAGPQTRIIDAGGKLVVPGFNDAHVHFLDGGFSLTNVNLRDATSPEEFARRIGEFAKKLPKGQWIRGGEWDHEKWPGTPLPTKEMVDAVTPDNPIFVNRTDGHMALANSVAMKLAGITPDVKAPAGGEIVRDAKGVPTGIFKDSAMDLIYKVVPEPNFDQKLQAAQAASEYAASVGVTSVQDMSTGEDIGVYQKLHESGKLKTRIYGMRSVMAYELMVKSGFRAPFGDAWLRVGGLKGFADGSLGSSTALFFEPFSDMPNTSGLLFDQMLPEGIMLKRVLAFDKVGQQSVIHAIGDKANHLILDIYQTVTEQNGPRDRRPRIEHAQHIRADDVSRFGKEGVIPSVQPFHVIDDGRWCDRRIGPERSKTTYPFRTFLDTGAKMAFGTDWTVAPLDPMISIYAAVTRRTLDGKHPGGWVPEQKITVEEAVRCYTVNSAYAEYQEEVKGALSVGKLADMVILDQNIFKIDPVAIENTKVLVTIVDGKVVFERK